VAAQRRAKQLPDRPPYAPLNAQEVVNRRAIYKKETVCLPLRPTIRIRDTHTCPPT